MHLGFGVATFNVPESTDITIKIAHCFDLLFHFHQVFTLSELCRILTALISPARMEPDGVGPDENLEKGPVAKANKIWF